jgi:hypothetical protein
MVETLKNTTAPDGNGRSFFAFFNAAASMVGIEQRRFIFQRFNSLGLTLLQ